MHRGWQGGRKPKRCAACSSVWRHGVSKKESQNNKEKKRVGLRHWGGKTGTMEEREGEKRSAGGTICGLEQLKKRRRTEAVISVIQTKDKKKEKGGGERGLSVSLRVFTKPATKENQQRGRGGESTNNRLVKERERDYKSTRVSVTKEASQTHRETK